MARDKRKIKPSTIIISIIFICSIATFSYFIIENYNSYNKELKNQENLNSEISKLTQTSDEITEKQNNILKEKDDLENIDNTINDIKKEVFSLASELENKIKNGESNKKIAYLTFDDGPYYSTDRVLSILKEYKIKATFFTIGLDKDICYDNRNYSCAETYKKEVDAGHTIANHTYSHAIFNGLYTGVDSFMNQVKLQEELIENRTGVKTNILRFPGGSATVSALAGVYAKNTIIERLKENGYGWVDWTAQDGDGGNLTDYSTGWRNFTGSINDNIEVVLFHDYNNITISLLPEAIEYLQNNDYILLPLFYDSVMVNK